MSDANRNDDQREVHGGGELPGPDRDATSRPWPTLSTRVISILLATLVYPVVLWGAIQAWERGRTRVEDWLPEQFAETQLLIQFFEHFGSDELLMIGWESARTGDPQLAEFRRRLLRPDPSDPDGRVFFDEAWTADSISESMQDPPLRLTQRQARLRMAGWILGKDGATATIALVSADGMADRHAAVAHARRAAVESTQLPLDEIHLAGPTIESVFIDESSQASLLKLNGFSLLICFLVLCVCVRRVFYAFIIMMIAVYCEQSAMALIHYSGGRMDSVLLLTANLTAVLSISASIHMFGYYRHAVATKAAEGPARTALREAFPPTFLAAFTTAIGFGSLALARVVPVHNFGFYSAIAAPTGALLTLWYLAMYLPARHRGGSSTEPDQATGEEELASDGQASSSPDATSSLRYWPWVFALVAMMLAFGAIGARRLQTTIGLHDLFPDDAKLVQDYRWLEDRIGPLVPIETVLELPPDEDRKLLEEMRLLALMQGKLRKCDSIDVVLSALNFTPPVPRQASQESTGSVVARTVMERRLSSSLGEFESFRMLSRKEGRHRWRLGARVRASEPIDYDAVMAEVRQAADEALSEFGVEGATVTICGGVPVAARTQQRLMTDLATSFMVALALIGITLAVVLRSVTAGLLAIIPNILPAVVVFGTMGWWGFKAEVGAVMTASAVLGIAIDDSLHLIVAFRTLCRRGHDRQSAAAGALRTCRAAIIHTSLVCGFGMLIFAASPFVPIQRFAWVMFTLLAVALVADLLLLPCILFSPLGRFFQPTNSARPEA